MGFESSHSRIEFLQGVVLPNLGSFQNTDAVCDAIIPGSQRFLFHLEIGKVSADTIDNGVDLIPKFYVFFSFFLDDSKDLIDQFHSLFPVQIHFRLQSVLAIHDFPHNRLDMVHSAQERLLASFQILLAFLQVCLSPLQVGLSLLQTGLSFLQSLKPDLQRFLTACQTPKALFNAATQAFQLASEGIVLSGFSLRLGWHGIFPVSKFGNGRSIRIPAQTCKAFFELCQSDMTRPVTMLNRRVGKLKPWLFAATFAGTTSC